MKIYKSINFDQEIEIDLNSDDIMLALREDGCDQTAMQNLLYNLNQVAYFLKGIPDELIDKLTSPQRDVIRIFLRDHAERFK